MPIRHSISSSSSRKRVPLAPLPTRLQLLEQLSLSLSVSKTHKRDVRYELEVTHAPSGISWTHRRSFEEYHDFQQHLLRAMKHGHFCQAECPYLYTFIKSYFPRPALFGAASSCVMEKRRDALEQCLTTLQKFLVSRANMSCAVLSEDVAREVVAFVVGDVANPKHPLHLVAQQQQQELKQQQSADFFTSSSRSSCLSFVSSTSDESEDAILEADGCPCVCTICNSGLDGEAFAEASSPATESDDSHSHIGSSRGSSSSFVSRCSSLSYTTTLACGHVFHDECIVTKLNENMVCPTCGVAVTSY